MRKGRRQIVPLFLAAIMVFGAVISGIPSEVKAAEQVRGYLTSKADAAQHLSVDGGRAEEGKGLILWPGPAADQEWKFEETSEGSKEYTITNIVTNMAVTATEEGQGSQLIQKTLAEGDASQIWVFESTDTEKEFRIKNKSTGLYITAAGTGNLSQIQQKALEDSNLQIWGTQAQINAVESTPVPEKEPQDHLLSGAENGQYLSVSGGSTRDGVEIMTWTGPEWNQTWKFQETEKNSGAYRIVNINSSLAITAENMLEGSRLVQRSIAADNEKQLWNFVQAGEGTYKIKNVATHLYLTADVSASGARILQKNQTDSSLQSWKMDEKVNTVEDTKDYAVKVWIKDGISVVSDKGAAVASGESVTFTIRVREGYKAENIKFLVNGREQTLADGGDGTYICTVANVAEDLTVKAEADVTTLNGYICIPENDYPGRNQCLSPRVVEGLDGTLYATFENGTPSELVEGEYSFPIYESKDKGDTWKRVGEITNDDSVHPDSYYKVTSYTDTGAPQTAQEVGASEEGAVRHPWSMQNCPQLFVLPQDQGNLKAGTLICAGVAVPLEEGAEKISDEGYGGLWESSLDLYYSTDGGRSWTYRSTIAEGGANGRNIMGYDPVWEPFFVYYNDDLICYYSDETDPAHAQKLVYKITNDGGATWGGAVEVVSISNRGARPGMPIVTRLENGKWMMVYETVGMTSPIKSGVKIADDPYSWNPSDPGSTLPGIHNVYGGSPYVYTLKDGRVVAGTGSLSEVFVNTKNDGTGEWVAQETGAPAGYNRSYIQLSSGEFLISGTEGAGFASQGNKIFAKKVPSLSQYSVTIQYDDAKGTVKAEDGTVIDAGSAVHAGYKENIGLTFVPKEGYQVKDVLVEQASVGAVAAYTVENIEKNMTVEVEFEQNKDDQTTEPGGQDQKPGDQNPGGQDQKPGSQDQKPGGQAQEKPADTVRAAKTGDTQAVLPVAVILLLSGASSLILVSRRKRTR